jgi:hypothetical protein
MRQRLVMAVFLLMGPVVPGVAQHLEPPGEVIPGRADLRRFDLDHDPHAGDMLILTEVGRPGDNRIVVQIICPGDRQSVRRAFDDSKTPVWFVPPELDRAIRGRDIRRYRGSLSYVSIGSATAADAVAEARRRYGKPPLVPR